MQDVLIYFIPLVMAGVVIVLVLGLGFFLRDGNENRVRSNKMMQWRVILQFVAVALIVLLVLVMNGT